MAINRNLISGVAFLAMAVAVTIFISLPENGARRLSFRERRVIARSDTVMRVLDIGIREDSLILRQPSWDFVDSDLKSGDFAKLAIRMVRTVQDPRYDGVGLAAPQVGVNHRLVVVCRVDKEGEPFEFYPNIHIDYGIRRQTFFIRFRSWVKMTRLISINFMTRLRNYTNMRRKMVPAKSRRDSRLYFTSSLRIFLNLG